MHVVETTKQTFVGMFGKCRAITCRQRGADNIQAQQAYIGDEQNTLAVIREQHTTQLQDAVSRYLPALYRRAYRYVGDPHDAEDAVQDALLSAYKHLNQFKATAKMTTWLTAIVTNSALTKLRRRPRHSHVSLNEQFDEEQNYSLIDTLADARPNPEDEYAGSELQGFIMQFLSELSPSLQQAIRLRYLEGLTVIEVSRILEVSVPTMKSRLWRARAQLKQKMRGL
jgi:RNA polymerase sigma-70 factor (ECF subfamily)